MKIKKKPKKTQASRQVLPFSGRDLTRPKIDGLCAKVAALQVLDDAVGEEFPAESGDQVDAGPQGGSSRF